MKKIHITVDDYQIISSIFQGVPFDLIVFGSRIKGTHQKFSDLDLCLKGNYPIDLFEISRIKEALSESDLPFTVDLVDYNSVSDGFKKIIDSEGVRFLDAVPNG